MNALRTEVAGDQTAEKGLLVAAAGLIFAAGLYLYAALLFGAQLYFWLRYGAWVQLPLSEIVAPLPRYPDAFPWTLIPHLSAEWNPVGHMTWAGWRKIAVWLIDVNLSLWSAIVANIVLCAALKRPSR